MIYYLYKITNKLNNKIYIGVHETLDINDGYMGSGKIIKSAVKKYGRDKFDKTIIEIFECAEQMYERDKEIVNEEFLSRPDVYNLALGGSGGSISLNRKPFTGRHSEETKNKISNSNKGKIVSEETKEKLKLNNWAKHDPEKQREHAIAAAKKLWENRTSEHFRSHYQEIRDKISESLKNKNRSRDTPHPLNGIKREIVKCPHCEKEGAMNTMKRWHFDNCKLKDLMVDIA